MKKLPFVTRGRFERLQSDYIGLRSANATLLTLCAGLRAELERRTDSLKDISRELALLRSAVEGPVVPRQRRAPVPAPELHPHRRKSDEAAVTDAGLLLDRRTFEPANKWPTNTDFGRLQDGEET